MFLMLIILYINRYIAQYTVPAASTIGDVLIRQLIIQSLITQAYHVPAPFYPTNSDHK